MEQEIKTEIVEKKVEKKPARKYNEVGFVEIGNKYAKDIVLKENYDVNGAMKALYLQCISSTSGDLTKLCTPASIELAIRKVLQDGLNPMKKQCYPIKVGNKLAIFTSYQGSKRLAYDNPLVRNGSIRAQVIHKGDTFIDKVMEDGRRVIIKHEQAPFEERSEEITGAYATVQMKEGKNYLPNTDLMTISQIRKSWAMSRSGGMVSKNFEEEMCKKTVTTRLCKNLYQSTNEDYAEIEETNEPEDKTIYDIDTSKKETFEKENDIVINDDGEIVNSNDKQFNKEILNSDSK